MRQTAKMAIRKSSLSIRSAQPCCKDNVIIAVALQENPCVSPGTRLCQIPFCRNKGWLLPPAAFMFPWFNQNGTALGSLFN
jgi:hypothetical protein